MEQTRFRISRRRGCRVRTGLSFAFDVRSVAWFALPGYARSYGQAGPLHCRQHSGCCAGPAISSTTFGQAFTIELSAENKTQLFIPVGCAHGFATLSEVCEVQYKQTGFYEPSSEGGIIWNDPDVGIHWPISHPILSKRDTNQITLKQYRENPAFR